MRKSLVVPKLEFIDYDTLDLVKLFKVFLIDNPVSIFTKRIFDTFPSLEKKLSMSKNVDDILIKFVRCEMNSYKNELLLFKDHCNEIWSKYSEKILCALSEINEIEWTSKHSKFFVRITICPVCPRLLEHNIFDVNFRKSDDGIIEGGLDIGPPRWDGLAFSLFSGFLLLRHCLLLDS